MLDEQLFCLKLAIQNLLSIFSNYIEFYYLCISKNILSNVNKITKEESKMCI